MKLLIPLILLLIGLGGGVGAGLALRSAPEAAAQAITTDAENEASSDADAEPSELPEGGNNNSDRSGITAEGLEYIKLNNQFVVPIVTKDSVDSIIVMSLSLEIVAGE
jgi:flagellar FliL protein